MNASRTASIGYSGMEILSHPLTVPPKRVFLSKKLSKSFMDEGYYEIAKIYRNVTDIFEDLYAEESF